MPKMTIKFGTDADKMLKELAADKRTTKADIIRRALMTYKYLNNEIADGEHSVSITSTAPTKKTIKDVILP